MRRMKGVLTGIDTVVLDLDGTLVDSNYVHVVAWREAFRDIGMDVPSHRLHGAIGIGGDQYVTRVTSEAVERAVGDEIRTRHDKHLMDRLHLVTATHGAAELLSTLAAREVQVVLASSSDQDTSDRLLDLVQGASSLLAGAVTGDQVERSKPSPDLIEAALRRVDAQSAVAVGDTVWDIEAAEAADVPCIAVLTGGVSERDLRAAGAVLVFESPADIVAELLQD